MRTRDMVHHAEDLSCFHEADSIPVIRDRQQKPLRPVFGHVDLDEPSFGGANRVADEIVGYEVERSWIGDDDCRLVGCLLYTSRCV